MAQPGDETIKRNIVITTRRDLVRPLDDLVEYDEYTPLCDAIMKALGVSLGEKRDDGYAVSQEELDAFCRGVIDARRYLVRRVADTSGSSLTGDPLLVARYYDDAKAFASCASGSVGIVDTLTGFIDFGAGLRRPKAKD
jgi:hypothetical protein